MAGSIKVTGKTAHAPAPKVPALTQGYYAAPKGVAPGWVIRYENGVPVGMAQINNSGQPGMSNSNVGLAPGYMLVVGADGKPQMVKGDAAGASKAAGAAPAAAGPAQVDGPVTAPHERTKPFLTADDLASVSAYDTSEGIQLEGLDAGLRDLGANTTNSLATNEQNAKVGFSNTNDDAAARGIFQSSIRDGGLADIEAKRATTANQLNDALDRAKITTDNQKAILTTAREKFEKWKVSKATENADAVESQIQPVDLAAAPAAPTTTPVSSAPKVAVPAAVNKPAIKAAQTVPTGTTSPVVTGQSAQGSSYTNTGKQPVKAPTKPKAPVKPKSFNSSN